MLFGVLIGEPLIDPYLYNCTDTDTRVPKNLVHGFIYFFIGLFCQILYVVVLKTFWQTPVLWEHGCYRIMFFLGIPDFFSLIVCAELAGIWSLFGIHPCYNITFSFLTGTLVFGTWHMSCFYVLILAFNRTCELVAPNLGQSLFRGKPLIIILCTPVLYFTYFTFFTKPLLYDPTKSTFLLNPNTEFTKSLSPDLYAVYGFIINNFFVMVFIGINYCAVCSFLVYHSFSTKVQKISKVYRQVTLQCMIVCTCHFIGCFLYIYMQYVELPQIFHTIAQLAWIGNHGLPPVVYLTFNATIRSKITIFDFKLNKSNGTKALESSIRTRQATIL